MPAGLVILAFLFLVSLLYIEMLTKSRYCMSRIRVEYWIFNQLVMMYTVRDTSGVI
jgi:hypothetical protein